MAVVAGALFGFTGQGMQWLQRLDGLVEQDIQAQAADLNRQRGLLGDASQMQNNLVAMAESRGLRGKAAYDAAVATQKEQMATQLQLNALNYAQPELRAKAEAAALAIRQSAAKDIASYQMKAREESMNARLKAAQIAKLTAETQETRLNMGAKAAGGGKDGIRPIGASEANRLRDLKQNVINLRNMERVAGAPAATRIWESLIKGKNAAEFGKLKMESMKKAAGGTLQSHEVPLLEPLFGNFSDVIVSPATKVAAERKRAEQELMESWKMYRLTQSTHPDIDNDPFFRGLDTSGPSGAPAYATARGE
jgi:hypothetical protein